MSPSLALLLSKACPAPSDQLQAANLWLVPTDVLWSMTRLRQKLLGPPPRRPATCRNPGLRYDLCDCSRCRRSCRFGRETGRGRQSRSHCLSRRRRAGLAATRISPVRNLNSEALERLPPERQKASKPKRRQMMNKIFEAIYRSNNWILSQKNHVSAPGRLRGRTIIADFLCAYRIRADERALAHATSHTGHKKQ